MSQLAVANHRA